jgi:hypothetical protein
MRLRQLVIADTDFQNADLLAKALKLGTPYEDPGVAEFGLVNRVYCIGDQFLEIVVPVTPSAPAARFLKKNGPGGYMSIFQVDDLAAARARCDGLNIRRVWNIDLPDISASHLHPADTGICIVSLDEPRPAASWRWGGPDWEKRSAPGRLTRLVVATPEPLRRAALWAEVLGAGRDGHSVGMQEGLVAFEQGAEEAVTGWQIESPHLSAPVEIGRLSITPAERASV